MLRERRVSSSSTDESFGRQALQALIRQNSDVPGVTCWINMHLHMFFSITVRDILQSDWRGRRIKQQKQKNKSSKMRVIK